jgi:hypothetical protein
MTEVIFSLDTEDYTNPGSDDAILRLAVLLREEGVRASFNIVAALAEALVERGRQDILDALRYHEINYHTYRHTWHPVPAEYSDTTDWDGPYRRLLAEEAPGIELVKRIFGRERLYAAVPPGNCVTAQGLYAYAGLGLPVCVSSFPMRDTGGRSIYYCNGIYIENNEFWDGLLLREGLPGALSRIEEWAGWERLVICMHPNILFYKTFWDAHNLQGANLVEWGKWRFAERRPPEVIEQFFADFRAALGALKRDPRFTFATFQQVVESQPQRPPLDRAALEPLLEAAARRFFHASSGAASAGGASYSLAELFAASLHFLNGGAGLYTLEPVAGPTGEPRGVTQPTRVSAAELRQAAARLGKVTAIPDQVQVGDTRIGPRDFLDAARQVLRGAERVELLPCSQMPEIEGFYHLDEANLAGTWMYSPEFRDKWVSKRLKWQAWTIHL